MMEEYLTQETISILGIIVAYVVQFLKRLLKKTTVIDKIKPQYLNIAVAVGLLYLTKWFLQMDMSFSDVWNGALTIAGASTLVHITDKITLRKTWSWLRDQLKKKLLK